MIINKLGIIKEGKVAFMCDQCGKFVSPENVEVKMITPDAEYTYETYEILCLKCKNNNRKEGKYNEML